MIKVKFEDLNKISRADAPSWIVQLFDKLKEKFEHYINRFATERNFAPSDQDLIFTVLWGILIKIVSGNSEYLSNTESFQGGFIRKLLTGDNEYNSSILESELKEKQIDSLIRLLMAPFILTMLACTDELTSVKTSNKALTKYKEEVQKNTIHQNTEIIVRGELDPILQKLKYDAVFRVLSRGYKKTIGAAISPLYRKYEKQFGNKRIFISTYIEDIQRVLRLSPDELTIESIERHI